MSKLINFSTALLLIILMLITTLIFSLLLVKNNIEDIPPLRAKLVYSINIADKIMSNENILKEVIV